MKITQAQLRQETRRVFKDFSSLREYRPENSERWTVAAIFQPPGRGTAQLTATGGSRMAARRTLYALLKGLEPLKLEESFKQLMP